MKQFVIAMWFLAVVALAGSTFAEQGEPVDVGLYNVYELRFAGRSYGPAEAPVKDVDFSTAWKHESGSPMYRRQYCR